MNKEIQEQALAHYDRMIAWVENLNQKDELADYKIMFQAISEAWFSKSCPYCQKYPNCFSCPLSNNSEVCCSGLWLKMYDAITWGEWLEYAKLVREYIKENRV